MDSQLRNAITSGRPSFWIAAFAFVTLIVLGLVFLHIHRDIPFDSTSWKSTDDLRPRMVQDLLNNHNLVGKSREVVDATLGVPLGRDSVRNGKYIYWAGTDGVIDDMWLEVVFDEDTVVSMYYVPD